MIFVLLPVRIVFVNYVTSDWFGSFGLISAIIVTLLYLSKKDKLGIFGRMFWKQSTKLHKGKRRIISYTFIAFLIYFWGSVVFGINYAIDNEEIQQQKLELQELLSDQQKAELEELNQAIENQDVKTVQEKLNQRYKSIDFDQIILAIPIVILLPFIESQSWALAVSLMDDFSNGYFLHFGTVFFIEALEVVGIMIYTKIVTRKSL